MGFPGESEQESHMLPSFSKATGKRQAPPSGHIPGRSLVLLRYLAAHPGRLVTKAELRQHVWGGTHVTDTVLRVCVQEIRAALGDAADAPQYLATVGRQGYQFLVGAAPEVAPPGRPAPWWGATAK